MTADQAREDLAFLSEIVKERRPALAETGRVYAMAGLLYGVQCVLHGIGVFLPGEGWPLWGDMTIGFLPTVLFLIYVTYVSRTSSVKGLGQGLTTRAVSAGFAGASLANMALVAIFAVNAIRQADQTIWLFYPATVCALQGAVWMAAAMIRRENWLTAVGAGWLVAAVLAGLTINSVGLYLLVIGAAMFLLMAVPGYIFVRMSRPDGKGA